VHDRQGRFLYANRKTFAIHGYDEHEFMALTLREIDVPESAALIDERMKAIAEMGEASFEVLHRTKDGTTIPMEVYVKQVDWGGTPAMLSTATDISERKRMEVALEASRRLVEESQRMGKVGGWSFDIDTREQTWTEEVYRIHEVDLTYKPTVEAGIAFYAPGSRAVIERAVQGAVEGGEAYDVELEIITARGNRRWVRAIGEADLAHRKVFGFFQDITGHRRAEIENARLEAQLQQAQKLESVGRLAGGVAHDFNNMLAAILGNVDLALDDVGPADPIRGFLEEIRAAAGRSADLTRQLLAFARKQTVAPRTLDLNQTVSGMLRMLQRLIGEDIQINWRPGSDVWPVKVDPSQVDQILANLCVNARDAIEDVGCITIETANAVMTESDCADRPPLVPGEYVQLTVTDNGCGMDGDTLSHLFEPFFTTKAQGKGTGLGLATVYGAVRQNDGYIIAESEPGHGARFSVYLPRHAASPVGQTRGERARETIAPGHETILLVEDEPAILRLTRVMLERQGYVVLEARTPEEAIEVAGRHAGSIDLLMTDVVMPGMNGRALANNLLSMRPKLKRLFMSGYTADIIAHHGVLEEGVHFIQKPFSADGLAAKVREALESA
jgi:PAS domain S-box-containing protein